MTLRHIVLAAAAVAVLGLGVYLFLAVRAEPATPVVTARPRAPAPAEPPRAPVVEGEADARPTPPVARPMRPTGQTPAGPSPTPNPAPPRSATETKNLEALMSEANKHYDRSEFEESRVIAAKVLVEDPTNVRMLRIMVSAACIDGDAADAQKHYTRLPAPDREQMKVRCARYGISFNES